MAMLWRMLVVAMVASVAAAAAEEYAECGRQAHDAVCLFGACCSKDGMCGRGEEYCGNGCQEGAGRCNQVSTSTDAECGSQAHGAVCLFGACCSEDGMCGRGEEYCGNGCQEGAGRCNQVPTTPAVNDAECGSQAHGAVCLFGACCSKDGMCGRGDEYCGNGCQADAGRCNKLQKQ
ncbi:hypothetical protein KC19_3G205200 [Ceratodon purpureus]|uniref:Chitin-binding type-1 domain-containing protein n=1 Tax=Ceratodon purpureus TaxID=3225 RepID=A0A8T0INE9_CERPU|nr:hypothetical protein KC19_3G205200 [Ceratodon purpureus]